MSALLFANLDGLEPGAAEDTGAVVEVDAAFGSVEPIRGAVSRSGSC